MCHVILPQSIGLLSSILSADCFAIIYRRRGKIHWAKHPWFQHYEIFHGNTFVVHWPPVFITYL